MRVAVVSDDPLLRAALTAALGDGAVITSNLEQVDVVLHDLGTRDGGGQDPDAHSRAERIAKIAEYGKPTIAVLDDPSALRAALEAGAKGVLLRDRVGPDLPFALGAVRGGLTVIGAGLSDSLGPRRVAPPSDDLTRRETQVVNLLVEGMSNKEIASHLGISEHTAKFHVNRILVKFDADSRTEAVVRALRSGIAVL